MNKLVDMLKEFMFRKTNKLLKMIMIHVANKIVRKL